jgi:FlgD Ig-like domain/Right handed beta helix region
MKRTLFLLCAVLAAGFAVASADTRYVDPLGSNTSPYTTPATAAHNIQDAINVASGGDVIAVAAGTYTGSNIHLTVAVTIIGSGTASTFFDGGGSGNIFYVDVDGVTVKDLTIQNGAFAVRFEKAGGTIDNTEFNNVQFKDNSSRGIEIHNLTTVTDLRVIACRFENNNVGIRMASSSTVDGLTITGSTFDTHSLAVYQANDGGTSTLRNLHIDDCTFTKSSDTAIYAEEIRDSIVENSTFTENNRGITIFKAYTSAGVDIENVTIQGNEFNNCDNWPILLFQYSSGLAGDFKILDNTVNQDVGVLTNNYGMIDIRLYPSFSHSPVTISGNKVYFTGTFAGGAGATAAYAIKLRGGLSDIKIDGNTLDGGSVADGGGVPPLSGIYFQVTDGTFGTIPATSVINITGNTIRDFVNGISVYDPTAAAYGGLLTGTTVNVTECNQIFGNSSHGIRNDGTSETINAPGNWWGDPSGPTYVSNLGGTGDQVSDNVFFTPWGTSASCGGFALHNFVFLANECITIARAKQSASMGNLHSNNLIYFQRGDPNSFTGDLSAVGNIKIDKEIKIIGDATAGGKITLGDHSSVTGTKTSHAAVATIPIIAPAGCSPSGTNRTVKKDGSLTLAPGSYGKVIVGDYATLKLSAGNYCFDVLETKSESELQIDVSGGPVTITVMTSLKLGKKLEMSVSAGEAGSSAITFNALQSTKVLIDKGSYVLGSFIAPNAEVFLSKNVSFRGSICAKSITVDRDVVFLHHTSPGALPHQKAMAEENEEVTSEQAPVTSYELLQNYPNPFNPSTTISFALPEAGEVTLAIYNIYGQLVRQLVAGQMNAGRHSVIWNATNNRGQQVASGVYLYVIKAGEFTAQRKLVLMK